MKLYVVFQHTISTYNWRTEEYIATETEFQGVFDTKERAESICVNERYWIGVCELNEPAPDGPAVWEEAYYPHEQNNEEK